MDAKGLVSQYREKCFNSFDNFELKSHRQMYHFTSFENLEKILSSKLLLHTKSNELNDSLEIKYALQYLSEILHEAGFKSSNNSLKEMIERYFENIEIYIYCFSETVDDLSLWRLYADKGLGVSIGFSQNLPFDNETNLKTQNIPILSKVIYGEACFKKKMLNLARRASVILDSQPFKLSDNQEELHLELVKGLSLAVIMNTFNTKHKHFSVEQEIRSIMLQGKLAWCSYNTSGWYFDESDFIPIKKKKFVATYAKNKFDVKGEEFESKKLKSPKFEISALRSITLGSTHNKAKSTCILQDLLKRNGFDINSVKIEQFASPYIHIE
jgi:hypothetical protein